MNFARPSGAAPCCQTITWMSRSNRGRDAPAYFSRAPTGTALVFVRGFNGNALTAGERMHELLPREDNITAVDVVFSGYGNCRAPE